MMGVHSQKSLSDFHLLSMEINSGDGLHSASCGSLENNNLDICSFLACISYLPFSYVSSVIRLYVWTIFCWYARPIACLLTAGFHTTSFEGHHTWHSKEGDTFSIHLGRCKHHLDLALHIIEVHHQALASFYGDISTHIQELVVFSPVELFPRLFHGQVQRTKKLVKQTHSLF